MKKILFFIILFSSPVMAIDDASSKNFDKYRMLHLNTVGSDPVIEVSAIFFPPEGKKVNSASMIRLWEKVGNVWQIADKAYADNEISLLNGNQLKKTLTIKNQKSDHALEVDFIHCDYQGGQCQMQKYLCPLKKSKNSKNQSVKMNLKLAKN